MKTGKRCKRESFEEKIRTTARSFKQREDKKQTKKHRRTAVNWIYFLLENISSPSHIIDNEPLLSIYIHIEIY